LLVRLNDLLKKHHLLGSWLLMLAAVVFFQGALKCGFVSDDVEQILKNPFIKNPHLWRRIFLGRVWSFAGGIAQASFYRPLHMFTYWLICRVAGFNPAAYHTVQLALYALTIWVVYRIARKLLANDLAAFTGALLWTLHPLHVEAVAWAAAIPEIGCTLFCLLGFWMFLRAEDQAPGNFWWHVAAALVYFPALFFKELAFSFPLLLLVYWLCLSSAQTWSRRALNWLPYAGALAVCVAVRVLVMGNISETSRLRDLNLRVARVAVALLGQHARLFFWPVHLNVFRSFDLAASLHSPWPVAAVLAGVAAFIWRKREPKLCFLILWWFVTLAPCLNYRYLSIPFVADRFSYLPSVGLCLALGYLAFEWLPLRFPRAHVGRMVIPAVTIVAALWAMQTLRTIPQWHDNDSLSNYSLAVSANSAEMHVAHGVNLQFQTRDLNGAAREFQTALRLNAQSIRPAPAVVYNADIGLGQVALMQGREQEALDYFNTAVRLMPNYAFAYNVLGSYYFPRRDYARATDYFQQAVRIDPMDMGARFFLGTCWMKLGKPALAAEQFHAAREVDPTFLQAYTSEAAALEAVGDKAGAVRVRMEMSAQ
jgi:tetratricopeptide (TPR) repeat protein